MFAPGLYLEKAFQSQIWYSSEAAGGLGVAGRVTGYQFRKPGGGMKNLSAKCQVFTGYWKMKGAEKKKRVWGRVKKRQAHTPFSPSFVQLCLLVGTCLKSKVPEEGPHSPAVPDGWVLAPSKWATWMREPLAPKQSLGTTRWGLGRE